MEHKEQANSHRRVSDQPGIPGVSVSPIVPSFRAPLATALLTAMLLSVTPLAYADATDARAAESSRSTAAQVWGYAQGITQNITQGVASWFGRGESGAERSQNAGSASSHGNADSRRAEIRRPDPDASSATWTQDLMLEAFPALNQANTEDTLRLLDGSQEPGATEFGFNTGPMARERDLSASYVWESPRFGQFILSTNAGYQSRSADRLLESNQVLPRNNEPGSATFVGTVANAVPELQSSFTFTWQIGNHTATAVTTYADALDNFSGLPAGQINIEQLNELVGQISTLDLRYGYSVRTGRQSSASISVGVRNMFDRRPLAPAAGLSNRLTEPSRVAYGTIKYQF